MGFMAGFGAGFADSFNKEEDRRAQEEQDLLRMTYTDYVNQRNQRQEWEREDAKAVRLAKALTEANGHPPEAWTKAHELLRNGASESTVQKFLESNQLIVGPKTVGSGPAVAGQEQAQPQGASAQMGAGAMGGGAPQPQPGATPLQPEEAATETGFSGLLGGLFDKSQRDKRRREEALGKVANATGSDIESVKKVLEGPDYASEDLAGTENYQVTIKPRSESSPEKVSNLNEALTFQVLAQEHFEKTGDDSMLQTANKLVEGQKMATFITAQNKADAENLSYKPSGVVLYGKDNKVIDYAPAHKNDQGDWVNTEDGTVIVADGERITAVKPMTQTQEKEIDEIYKETGKASDAYTERVLGLQSIIRDSKDMQEIVASNPGVLSIGGEVAQWTDRQARNIDSIIQLFTDTETGETVFDTQDEVVNKAFTGAEGPADDGMNFTAQGVSALQDLEERMMEVTGGEIQDTAVARALLESKALRMTYAWAATQNQKGRAVSNEEFKNIYNAVMANGNPTAFGMEHKNFIDDMMQSLDSEADMINKHNSLVTKFEKKHGFRPGGIVRPIDEILAESPETLDDLNAIRNGTIGQQDPALQGAPEDTGLTTNEDLVPIGKTPEGITVYRNSKTGEQGTME